jgi:hypothetical protein
MLGEDSLLYRIAGSVGGWQVCIPAKLTVDILAGAHDALAGGGHNRVERTMASVNTRFYWPRLYETVRAWIRGCETCLRVKASNQRPAGLLTPLEIPSTRGKRVNIDFVTKLLTTTRNHDTIITIIDGLTKCARWFATREADLTSERFAQLFIKHYVRMLCVPISIFSDEMFGLQARFGSILRGYWAPN